MPKNSLTCLAFFLIASLTNCYRMRSSHGGGQVKTINERYFNSSDIALPPDFKIDTVATGLTFPSAVCFDNQGQLYAIETGYAYGEIWGEPKLIRIDKTGGKTVIAKGAKNGPWTGVAFHNEFFYVAEGGESEGGKILRIRALLPIQELWAKTMRNLAGSCAKKIFTIYPAPM